MSYYEATLGWFWENRHRLAPLRRRVMLLWLRIMKKEGKEMNDFTLEPGDILVKISKGKDPFSIVKRWALGSPYEHVFLYLGEVRIITSSQQEKLVRIPMLFESNGRGVVIQALSNRYGEDVAVMRLKSEFDRRRIPRVLVEAVKLASDERARYDYLCIVKYVLPELLCRKLDALLPGEWTLPRPLTWERNASQICSEAVFEIFYRAKLADILRPFCRPPMPGDFVTDSALLEVVWDGGLSESLISQQAQGHR